MSELPRRIVSRLRRFIGNRRASRRVRARLSFTLSLSDPRVNSNGSRSFLNSMVTRWMLARPDWR